MIYKMFNKDVVVYYGQDAEFIAQPVEIDGSKPSQLTITGFVYRPGDDIDSLTEDLVINGYNVTIPYDPSRRFDYSYRYNLYVTNGQRSELYQYGNVIFKNEHRVSN